MGSSVSTQATHPLTACVAAGTQRDVVGHLVTDERGDREFRFVKIRGSETASMGHALVAFRLSGATSEDSFYNVSPLYSTTAGAQGRDFVGIFVGGSTAASGDFGWAMTRGQFGKKNGSLYPSTIWCYCSGVAAGEHLVLSGARAGVSEHLVTGLSGLSNVISGAVLRSGFAKQIGVALSTAVGGSQLTRGMIRSPLVHGGGYGPRI